MTPTQKFYPFISIRPSMLPILVLLLNLFGFVSSALGQSTYYATPNGNGAGTQQGDPTNLTDGLALLADGDILQLAAGTYNIMNPILNVLPNDATLEGGFDASNGWIKAGTTTIHRTAANAEGIHEEQRIGAIYMQNKSGFTIKDISITTADAPATSTNGITTYGLHLHNCSDYTLHGINIQAGNASAGAAGTIGANGAAGGNATTSRGGNGGGFPNSGGTNNGSSGNPGLQATVCSYGSGGGGGGAIGSMGQIGGNGGADCNGENSAAGGGVSGTSQNDPGENGVDGENGADGTAGSSPILGAFYFLAGGPGTVGATGIGGTGGGGGQGEIEPLSGNGQSGGNGGGGGQAGTGGSGGYGGGGSFALYLYQNGTGASITASTFTAGAAGLGGAGGSGGAGGNGGNGTTTSFSGNGGNGGDGGDGGTGGNGRNGLAQDMYLNGTTPNIITLYVNNAPSIISRDGSSWATAYEHLQEAIDVSNNNIGFNYQIWIAEGTYYPTADNPADSDDTPRDVTFYIHKNVEIYGGFLGSETTLAARDWENNLTILSGDIYQNTPNNENNAYHVMFIDGTTSNGNITNACIIDGLLIRDGKNSNNLGFPKYLGAGIVNNGMNNNECSPTIRNCNFVSNTANIAGGAIYNVGVNGGTSSPTLINCSFSSNTVDYGSGGAIYNDGSRGTSSPTLINCIFSSNTADNSFGGAIYNAGVNGGTSSPTLINCSFSSNTAFRGGAIYNRGEGGTSSPTLINCSFSSNTAFRGGAIYNNSLDEGICNPKFTNCSFSYNDARDGRAIYNVSHEYSHPNLGYLPGTSNPIFNNCILWNNGDEIYNTKIDISTSGEDRESPFVTTTLNYSIIDDENPDGSVSKPINVVGDNNLDSDPLFIDSANDDLRLQNTSPAINAGDNDAIPMGITTDLDGNNRILDNRVDIGAYEIAVPLPLAFLELKGMVLNNGNRLDWLTLNEQNASLHIIERSSTGKDFIAIGKVEATGNTLMETHYEWMDEQPLNSAYYRIRTLDTDGKERLSNTILLLISIADQADWMNLYPNPAQHQVQLDFVANNDKQQYLRILDITGRTIWQQIVQVQIGQNQVMLDLHGFSAGSYFVQLLRPDSTFKIEKLMVQY